MGEKIVLAVFLALCTYWDMRYRKIPLWLLVGGVLAGVAGTCFSKGICWNTIQDLFGGLIPGFCVCLTARFLPGYVGMADGWMLMAAGELGGFKTGICLLEWGLILMFPIAFFWCAIKRKRDLELPFAPFIMGGFLWQILCGIIW